MSRYAVTPCSCGRLRVIDLSSETSICPFCGKSVKNANVRQLYADNDPHAVRDALAALTGFEAPEEDLEAKRRVKEADPLSTLIHKYEGCSDVEEKMTVLSKGLTDIFGTFTLDDLKRVDRKNAEKILEAMVLQCMVFEPEPGRYKA